MTIAIVMSTYNGINYIKTQLDSIKNQICVPDRVIICDDRSSDGTYEFIQKYITDNKLDYWTVLRNEKNIGWKKNFKKMIIDCDADWIICADQDDYWHNYKIQNIREICQSHSDVDLIVSNYQECEDKDFDSALSDINSANGNATFSFEPKEKDFLTISFPGCTYCVNHKLVNSIKHYWSDNYAHDAFIWRAALIHNSIIVCQNQLIIWRKHNESVFGGKRKKDIHERLQWIHKTKEMISDLILLDKNCEIANRNMDFLTKREETIIHRRFTYGFYMLKYLKYYPSVFSFFNEWKMCIKA